ncbi:MULTISPECIES: PTS transporter subunit EIIB [unclassified Pseudomonas]|uniref:PTS transporter subunit EIIB n=1 Tax=unclassified Pseudomonas TaxID=196821 RepID=UPI000BDB20A3|nr:MULTISPECIES: PTS transporter subunit EIIB [unclassified Pseudomonas]PVZ15412.1 phosphotransferase system EIIB protein [Pseudomonas sp. URIL14HWK12:I12]PVZ24786.1 phosphotransferase system EIIB protein [Pseudomonas sp. URIL14HWK12:I10]PVZ34632.1 phosphotransferase system EIIB protein [Pseudomonas sp. URIL14HWK12:I11]SNZ08823.1 Phosphotransferase system IIB components [Pseudomonas sp. URIL14HWK12:I9]
MLRKLQTAFWKALTPDLVPDGPPAQALPADAELPAGVLDALGGPDNLASQQRVAVTRVRVQLRDANRLDQPALLAAGIAGVMVLAEGVIHLLAPVPPAAAAAH